MVSCRRYYSISPILLLHLCHRQPWCFASEQFNENAVDQAASLNLKGLCTLKVKWLHMEKNIPSMFIRQG